MEGFNKKSGRKTKSENTYENLLDLLKKYVKENPDGIYSFKDLEEKTGIKWNVWRDNKKIRKDIEYFKNKPLLFNRDDFGFLEFESAENIVISNIKNTKRMIQIVDSILEAYHRSFKEAMERTKALQQIDILKNENEILKLDIAKLIQENRELVIYSRDPLKREELGIKDNVLQLTPKNCKVDIARLNDHGEDNEFNDLFKDG